MAPFGKYLSNQGFVPRPVLEEATQATAITDGAGVTFNTDTNPSEIADFTSGSGTGLEDMVLRCRKEGDAFGFEAASRALGKKPEAGEWKELGGTALALGKLWFAYRAYEKAEDQGGLDKVRQSMTRDEIEHPPR